MKYLIVIVALLFNTSTVFAQNANKKNRKQTRNDKELLQKESIRKLINSGNFCFEATHAIPMTGRSVSLNNDYDVKISNDSVFSYLPFYGVAYHIEYGARNGVFTFNLPAINYYKDFKKEKFTIKFEVKNGMDNITYHFQISELGYATLLLNSTNRQAISYYGTIEEISSD